MQIYPLVKSQLLQRISLIPEFCKLAVCKEHNMPLVILIHCDLAQPMSGIVWHAIIKSNVFRMNF